MSEKEDKPKKKTRREFLQQIGIVGAGTILAGSAIYAGFSYQNKKKPGDRIKVLTAENELIEVDKNDTTKAKKVLATDLTELQKEGREGIPGKRWVYVVDLSKCRNARKCMSACNEAHHLRPEQHHINTLLMKESKNTPAYYMPFLAAPD